MLERGARSGVGVALFERGGLAVDAGRGPDTDIPPVVACLSFPRDWRILLILDPRVEGAHGAAETRAFAELPPFPAGAAAEICRRTLMQILAGVAERISRRSATASPAFRRSLAIISLQPRAAAAS